MSTFFQVKRVTNFIHSVDDKDRTHNNNTTMHWCAVIVVILLYLSLCTAQIQLACNDTVTVCTAFESCCCPVPLNLCACCTTGTELCLNGTCVPLSSSASQTASFSPSTTRTPSATPTSIQTPSASALCPSPSPIAEGYEVISCGKLAISTASNGYITIDSTSVSGSVTLNQSVVLYDAAATVNMSDANATLSISNTRIVIDYTDAQNNDFVVLFTVASGNISIGDNVTVDVAVPDNAQACERRNGEAQQRDNTLGVLITVDSSRCSSGRSRKNSSDVIAAIVVPVVACCAVLLCCCITIVLFIAISRVRRMRYSRTADDESDNDRIVERHSLARPSSPDSPGRRRDQ